MWLVLLALVSCSSKDAPPGPAPAPAPATAKVVIPADAKVIPPSIPIDATPIDAPLTAAEKRLAASAERAAQAEEKHAAAEVAKAAAKEKRQDEIVEAFNVALHAGGTTGIATVDEDDLLLVDHVGSCDKATLPALRKGMAAMGFDPADAFKTMQCPSDGIVLKLH